MWALIVPSPKGTSVMIWFIFTAWAGGGVLPAYSSRIFFASVIHSSLRKGCLPTSTAPFVHRPCGIAATLPARSGIGLGGGGDRGLWLALDQQDADGGQHHTEQERGDPVAGPSPRGERPTVRRHLQPWHPFAHLGDPPPVVGAGQRQRADPLLGV